MHHRIFGYNSAAAGGNVNAIRDVLLILPVQERIKRINACNRFGFTPLHSAIFHDRVEMVDLLIALGADVNGRTDCKHWTYPLHLGALRGSLRLTKLLLVSGADPFLQDWEGFDPLSIAEAVDNKSVAGLLRQEMETALDDYITDLPDYADLSNGYDDLWWRVRQVLWKDDDTPMVSDHYSDGGTPASTLVHLNELRSQRGTRCLYRVASQPLTGWELEQRRPRL